MEQQWAENRLTAEGRLLHQRVDRSGAETRRDVRRVFGLLIRSLRLGVSIPEAALYYGARKRRQVVNLDDELRRRTADTARAVHEMMNGGRTPPARYAKESDRCSLLEACRPRQAGGTGKQAIAEPASG